MDKGLATGERDRQGSRHESIGEMAQPVMCDFSDEGRLYTQRPKRAQKAGLVWHHVQFIDGEEWPGRRDF